jgi:hypothetical protein
MTAGWNAVALDVVAGAAVPTLLRRPGTWPDDGAVAVPGTVPAS